MAIVTIERDDGTVLVVKDGFDASDARKLQELLLRNRDHAITVDFRAARHIEDFVIARLAPELKALHVLGLTDHQRRLLRYLRSAH